MSIELGPFVVQCRKCNTVLSDNSVYHSSNQIDDYVVFEAITNVELIPRYIGQSFTFLGTAAKVSNVRCIECSTNCGVLAHASSKAPQLVDRYTLYSKAIKSTSLGYNQYTHVSQHIQSRSSGGRSGGERSSSSSSSSSSSINFIINNIINIIGSQIHLHWIC